MGRGKMVGLRHSGVLVGGVGGGRGVLGGRQPRRGGGLGVAAAGDPPSLDMHQEQTFMVDIPMSPVYNTLVMFDPHNYPKVIGDLAKEGTVSADGLTSTFPPHQGVKFHDGSALTAADVKPRSDRIG